MRSTRGTTVLALALVLACAGGTALGATASAATPTASATTPTASAATPTASATTPTATATTPTATTPTDTTTTSTTPTTPATPMLQVCIAPVRRLIAGYLGVRVASIADRQFLASNGMPQCNFVIPHARRGGPAGKVVVTANVDNGPQPHWRLMRKVVEATQIFGPTPKGFRPPFHIRGLGPNGSWFPALDQMMCNNLHGRYLITVGVIWHHTTQAEKIAISRTVILKYRHIRRLPA